MQSAFSHILACSEWFKLSSIWRKWATFWSWSEQIIGPNSSWQPWTEPAILPLHPPTSWLSHYVFLSYVETIPTCTNTQRCVHWCLFFSGDNNMSLESRYISSFDSLHWSMITYVPLALSRSYLSTWEGAPFQHQAVGKAADWAARVFSVAFVVDLENKQMCIDVQRSKNSVPTYWLFHT